MNEKSIPDLAHFKIKESTAQAYWNRNCKNSKYLDISRSVPNVSLASTILLPLPPCDKCILTYHISPTHQAMKLFPINYCLKSLVDYLVLVPLHYPWQGFWHIAISFSEHKQISARILSSKRLIRGGKMTHKILSPPLPAAYQHQSHPLLAQNHVSSHQRPPHIGLCCPPSEEYLILWFIKDVTGR